MRRFALREGKNSAEGLAPLIGFFAGLAKLLEQCERRCARLAYDVHDGPLQEISALRMQLRLGIPGSKGPSAEAHEQVLAAVAAVESRLAAIDAELRQLVHAFDSPLLYDQPFEECVRRLVDEFHVATGCQARLDIKGSFDLLSSSQRIALVRILAGSLANVRKHAGARSVDVRVRSRAGKAELVVRDDGRGFDVERTLSEAAHRGRLGLVAMSERVRLLGGRFDIVSKPGGPTVVRVTLQPWRAGEALDWGGRRKRLG